MNGDPWRTRRLPESLREELRRPLGRVRSGEEAFEEVRDAERVVTVGDACSIDLAERGRAPDIAVVDFKTKRVEDEGLRTRLRAMGGRAVSVRNPAASLTREVWETLSEAFKSGQRVRVEVLGEEDLIALAAIDLAPEGTAVLYGMPDEGVVVVWADATSKAAVRDLLGRMDDDGTHDHPAPG